MPQCSQCTRPAMFEVGGHPLCLEHHALAQTIELRRLDALERQADRALEEMEWTTGVQLPRRPRAPRPAPVILQGSTFNHINVQGSNVGVLNTGRLSQVDTAISVIGQQGDPQLAGALKTLTDAVVASATLAATAKQEAIEILSTLGTEATAPPAQRRGGVARTLLTRLKELLSVSADLIDVGHATWPFIAAAFGVSTS
jgi:hypothetical protein